MSWISVIRERASRWLDHVVAAMLAWRQGLRPPRLARILEQDDGSFQLQAPGPRSAGLLDKRPMPEADASPRSFHIIDGAIAPDDAALLAPRIARARVEIVLRPERFLFRPLQLPRRAADFLEAIIRSQIDRLTPWSPAEAAFGFRSDAATASDRMDVVIAATARAQLAPFVAAVGRLGAEAVSISTPAPDGGPAPIRVMEQRAQGAVSAQRLRRGLTLLLAALGCLAVAVVAAAGFAAAEFEARRDEIDRRIAQRRAEMLQNGDPNSAAALALQQRKRDTPATVIVYDELSRILPDDAYLTELRIQGDKAQIAGVARDAPGLIRLIEQSPHFKAATFYAPTTRSRSESGQHFFIEAQIQPVFPSPGAIGQ